jgi:hypothetical protein
VFGKVYESVNWIRIVRRSWAFVVTLMASTVRVSVLFVTVN